MSTSIMPPTAALPPTQGGLVLRPAQAGDAAVLSDLAFRSKAFWGYSDSLMAAFREELTLTEAQATQAVVADVDGVLAGFYLLGPVTGALPAADRSEVESGVPVGELQMLFVEPDFIGAGVGRVLFQAAVSAALTRGWRRLYIEADPQAAGFYEQVGAVTVGERLGSVPGRILPLLCKTLPTAGQGGRGSRATYWR